MAEGARARRRAETRRAIEDAALTLFLADGYAATSMEAIARRAGVGARTVYRYFPRKRDLVFGEADVHLVVLLDALDAQPAGDPWRALHAAAGALAEVLVAGDVRPRARAALHDAELRAASLAVRGAWGTALAERLAERDPALAEDARLLAQSALLALSEAVERWSAGGDRDALPAIVDAVFDRAGRLAVSPARAGGRGRARS
jgi:AcrR family transcriptional regulator